MKAIDFSNTSKIYTQVLADVHIIIIIIIGVYYYELWYYYIIIFVFEVESSARVNILPRYQTILLLIYCYWFRSYILNSA